MLWLWYFLIAAVDNEILVQNSWIKITKNLLQTETERRTNVVRVIILHEHINSRISTDIYFYDMAGCTFSHQMKFDAVLFEDFYCVSPATIYSKHIDDAASSLLNKLIATLSCRPSFIDKKKKKNCTRTTQRSVFSHKFHFGEMCTCRFCHFIYYCHPYLFVCGSICIATIGNWFPFFFSSSIIIGWRLPQ